MSLLSILTPEMERKIELQQEGKKPNQTKNWADFLQCESGYSGQLVSCAGTVQHLYQSEP